MRNIFLFFILLLVLLQNTSLSAQQTFPNSPETFHTALRAELAKHQSGEYLYHHSDGYQRLIDYRVRKQLGQIQVAEEKATDPVLSLDTSRSFDASNNSLDQDETTVGINRANKSIVCIGANDDGMLSQGMPVYTSTNEGKTWKTYRLPRPSGSSLMAVGDPIIATDDHGTFYYAYLAGDNSELVGTITIATSTDGITWHTTTPIDVNSSIPGFPDKEHMTVDCSPQSPHYGRVYVVWYEIYDNSLMDGEGLNVVWSDDKCKTWSKPTPLGTGDDFQEIKTNSKGDVFVSFTNSRDIGQEFFVSTDGGKSFDERVIPITKGLSFYPLNSDHYLSLKGFDGFRTFPYVAFDVDLSNDRIHLVYPNYEDAPERMASVLYYTTSDNNGLEWSDPQLIGLANPAHSSAGFDRFNPWVTFDQKTHEAYALYYSSEQDPNNILSAAYRVKLTDELTDFPEMLHATFDPTIVETGSRSVPFIGDYTGSDAFDSVYVGTWTENRAKHTDGEVIAFISYPKPTGSSAVEHSIVIHSAQPWLSSPFPNPVSGRQVSVNYFLPRSSHITFELFDINGKKISVMGDRTSESGTYTEDFSLAGIPSGTFFLRMTVGTWQESRKLEITGRL